MGHLMVDRGEFRRQCLFQPQSVARQACLSARLKFTRGKLEFELGSGVGGGHGGGADDGAGDAATWSRDSS